MSDWPIGLSTGCFYQTSIFDCLETIRQGGFGKIEVCSFPAHLDYHDREAVERAAQRIQELGLEAYSFHAPFAERIDITALDAGHRDFSQREMLQAAESAARLGVRYFVIHPGPERGGMPPAERFERFERAVMVLDTVARRCRELGMALVLENMLPHLFSGHVRDLLWIMGALSSTDVGCCLDTGHAALSGDLKTAVPKLSGHLWMLHVSDNRGQRDDHLPPGEGQISWDELLGQLDRGGFHGAMILEIAGDHDRDRAMEAARRGRAFLKERARQLKIAALGG
ncbi:MAG: sugar phosphate isomerase/epimerase [Deltaproteobacteria bacterium]|nr:sugar phosphate isomerase/epimerase [Deltaproteobacteria bacterium]